MPAGRVLGILVSPEDADILEMNWNIDKDGYARRSISRKPLTPKTQYVHGLVAERVFGRKSSNNEVIDHINRNRLDNRRENLRMVSKLVNRGNTEKTTSIGFPGLRLRRGGLWQWSIKKNGRSYGSTSVCFGRAVAQLRSKRSELQPT